MKEAFDRKRIPWPVLTAQELTDVLVYLRNVREVRTQTPRFELSAGKTGMICSKRKDVPVAMQAGSPCLPA